MIEQDNLRSDSELNLKTRIDLLEIPRKLRISYILNSKLHKPGKTQQLHAEHNDNVEKMVQK